MASTGFGQRRRSAGRISAGRRSVVAMRACELVAHAPLSQHGRHEPARQASGAIGQRRVLDTRAEKLVSESDGTGDGLSALATAAQTIVPVEVHSPTDSTAAATSHNHNGRQAPWRIRCTHRCRNWSSGPTVRTWTPPHSETCECANTSCSG